jgi:hypothetical protein
LVIGFLVWLFLIRPDGTGPDGAKRGAVDLPILKPPVPVVVSTRDSAWGASKGKVAIFSNQTANRLTISVRFENKVSMQQRSWNIDLEPNGKAEFGWREGWKLEPGELIEMSHPDYRSVTLTVQ